MAYSDFDLDSSDGYVENCIAEDLPPLQPEQQDGYILVDLSTGRQYDSYCQVAIIYYA